ncbi:MAG: two-component regulator propeller domain-containing protein [Cyclobacteriaceae bacterium]|nr:two-component regulator propeller domain-containing protein [Cyclobacteriaceae bacterium]
MRIFPTFWHTCLLCLAIVFHLHGQDYSWKNYSVADGLPQTQVTYLTQDSRGFIWIGTKNGFSIFDGIEFENFSTKDGLDFDHINTIQEIDRDTHYIGTTGGLNVMEKGEIRVIGKNIQGKAYFIHCDSEGNLWYSHSQYGYCIYDSGRFSTDYPVFSLMEPGEQLNLICVQKKDKKLVFTSKAGNVFLPGPSGYRKIHIGGEILSLLEGEDANIYVANEHGLFRMENEGFTMVFGFQSPYHVLYVTNSRDFYLVDIGFQPNLYHCRDGRIVRIGGGMNLITVVLVDDEKKLMGGLRCRLVEAAVQGITKLFFRTG